MPELICEKIDYLNKGWGVPHEVEDALREHFEYNYTERRRLAARLTELEGSGAIQQAMFGEAMDRAVRAEKRLENIRQLTTTKHETLAQFVSRVRDALYLETR